MEASRSWTRERLGAVMGPLEGGLATRAMGFLSVICFKSELQTANLILTDTCSECLMRG